MTKKTNSGFTLVEFMLVVALGSVWSLNMAQSYQQDAMQSMAKKLGKTEIAAYTSAVQAYLTDNASDPSSVDGEVHTGVDWLKDSGSCSTGTGSRGYLPCNFLSSTGGSTTYGGMDFTTTITLNATSTATSPEGLEARTVLSKFATEDPAKTSGYVLGMAALVASTSSSSNFNNGAAPAVTFYCPDLTPMPATISAYCGAERDRLVSYAFTNGENDIWIRSDHGNTVKSAIEYRDNPAPASEAELDFIDSRNNRHLRNVSRIYNLNDAGDNTAATYENLIIGAKNGDAASGMADISSDGVIIDADMHVLGELIADGNIRSKQNVIGKQFVDEDDNAFLLDPDATSSLDQVDLNQLSSLGTNLNIRANEVNFDDKNETAADAILSGNVDVSNLQIRKNGSLYSLEELLPNLTFQSSHMITQPWGQSVNGAPIATECGGYSRVRVFVQPVVDEIVTKDGIGGQIRRVFRSGSYYYYRPENARYSSATNRWARNAQALLVFYCLR